MPDAGVRHGVPPVRGVREVGGDAGLLRAPGVRWLRRAPRDGVGGAAKGAAAAGAVSHGDFHGAG